MNIREQFNAIAKEYDANRRKFIPCFDEFYGETTDFIAGATATPPKTILDLGAGTGLLTAFWLRHFPDAEFVLADVAEAMLAVAKERFRGMPNVAFATADYAARLPRENADLVVSALSVHHLEHAAKRALFRRVRDCLPPGGLFVNYDQFRAENAETEAQTEARWTEQIRAAGLSEAEFARWRERKKLDRECTVAQEILWLKEAGFASAECLYLNGKFAVVRAEK
ncbi:MAG: class I SAM-dependent methyltransferase [Candidatus Spyradosoma sp.]